MILALFIVMCCLTALAGGWALHGSFTAPRLEVSALAATVDASV
jgi:hypothetical protein